MRWRGFYWLRLATLIIPCLWFVYVALTVFSMDNLSAKSRNLLQEGKGPLEFKDHKHSDSLQQQLPKDNQSVKKEADVEEPLDDAINVKDPSDRRQVMGGMRNLRRGVRDSEGVDQMGDSQEADREPDDILDTVNEEKDMNHPRRGDIGLLDYPQNAGMQDKNHDRQGQQDSDVSDDAGDVDPYADVTYPPYVERLPPGAVGQGPRGLEVVKEELSPEQQKEFQDKWDKNQFNQYVSDLIPVHRILPDVRLPECQMKQYPKDLPAFSVVMVFHNEAWSTLLRSVHSILDRTSPALLHEIVLVDDFSSMDHLKRPLEKYFRNYPIVRIVRLPQRGGLIKARLHGFHVSTAEVVIFLDSHIECTEGWAEPMLWLIREDYRTVPFPLIGMINGHNFRFSSDEHSPSGIFDMYSMTFKWSQSVVRAPIGETVAKPSPTMPGGLFAISRKWFLELGTFDPELEYWGGENLELSFKSWMCGGSIVIAECSHIGHIFRTQNPIRWTRNIGYKNFVRVALTWLDDYKNHYFERINYQLGDYGNISDRLTLRDRLQCHDFGWYVDNVYPELKNELVLNATYAGEILHEQSGLCLDRVGDKDGNPLLLTCHRLGGNQFWYFREDRYLQAGARYLCQQSSDSVHLTALGPHRDQWSYDTTSHQLKHENTGQCLEKRVEGYRAREVKLAPCRIGSVLQKWALQRRRPFTSR